MCSKISHKFLKSNILDVTYIYSVAWEDRMAISKRGQVRYMCTLWGEGICTYIVIKRRTSKFMLAATTAKPNSIKTKLKATYPGLLESAWSFCNVFITNKYYKSLSLNLNIKIKRIEEEILSYQQKWIEKLIITKQ